MPEPRDVPRFAWSPLPHEGCEGVEGRVLVHGSGLAVAQLRFAPGGTLHRHAAPHRIEVVCLEGSGRVEVGEDVWGLEAGRSVEWPAGVTHRLWTEETTMTTLMIERLEESP